jgi:hypothetical protein
MSKLCGIALLAILILPGCIIINNYPYGQKVGKQQNHEKRLDLLMKHRDANDPSPSLLLTLADKKTMSVSNCFLENTRHDTADFVVEVLDYAKTEILRLNFSVLKSELDSTKVNRTDEDAYKFRFKATDSTGKKTQKLFSAHDIRSSFADDSLVVRYSARLVNPKGNEYLLWCQTDPWWPNSIFPLAVIVSYIMEDKQKFLDLCNARYIKTNMTCKAKKMMPRYKPLLQLGHFSVGENMIKDCDVVCIGTK